METIDRLPKVSKEQLDALIPVAEGLRDKYKDDPKHTLVAQAWLNMLLAMRETLAIRGESGGA